VKEYLKMDKNFIVEETNRLDKFLASQIDASRNQIEQLIKKQYVKVDGKVVSKTGLKLKVNQEIEVHYPKTEIEPIMDEDFVKESLMGKDVKIIYEDDQILVINKPANLTVHGAPSVKDATLVDWLKLKNISLSTISGDQRHGIVHRLDKGTTGVMVVAKTNEAHAFLSEQLQDKTMGRYYLAITDLCLKEDMIIDKPIARNKHNRLKMAIDENGRNAKSAFKKIDISNNEKYELIAAKLFTGRTHQIRVHLSSIDRHILGDNLYGFKGNLNTINRFYLHAYNLYLIHPRTKEMMTFKADLPDDMNNFLDKHFHMENINDKIDANNIIDSFTSFT
jgi:23S rRNA pseudouridine1911/1915/1917 synthase